MPGRGFLTGSIPFIHEDFHSMRNRFPIVYQDEDIVAIHKPAGMLMHRHMEAPSQPSAVLQAARDQIGRYIFPVHRLDCPTSGVLVFALNREMARNMAARFAAHQVEKHYVAVLRGTLEPSGIIDYALTRDALQAREHGVLKQARTVYRRLATVEVPAAVGKYQTGRYSLAAITPQTGRMHQIRRHFHHISHPIIGDTTYGDGRHNRFFKEYFGCGRLLLAAVELRFTHPRTAQPLRLIAPLSSDFACVVRRLGWEGALPVQWLAGESGAKS